MPDKIDKTVLEIAPSPKNKQAERSIEAISSDLVKQRQEIKRLKSEIRDFERVSKDGVDVTKEWARAEAQLTRINKDRIDTEKQLKRAIDGTNTEIEDRAKLLSAERRQRQALGDKARLAGDIESRGRAISGAIGFVGGEAGARVERIANIGAEALAVKEAIGLLRIEFPEFIKSLNLTKGNVAALAVGLTAAAAAALIAKQIFDEWSKSAKEAKEQIVGTINATKEYYGFIEDATSEDLKAKIEETAARRDLNAQLQIDLLELKNAALQSGGELDSVGGTISDSAKRVADDLGLFDGGMDAIDEALSGVNTEIRQNEIEFGLYVEALTNGTAAANDAAKREQEYTQAKLDGLERERQLVLQGQTMSKDALDDRLDQIERERQSFNDLLGELEKLDPSEQTAARIKEVNFEISRLDEETRILAESVRPLVEERANEAAAVDLLAKSLEKSEEAAIAAAAAIESGFKSLVSDSEDIAKRVGARADEVSKRNDDITKQQIDFEEKQAKQTIKHYADLAKLDQKFYEDQADLIGDIDDIRTDAGKDRAEEIKEFNKESIRAAKDHQKELLSIQRDLGRGIESAVEDRNVAAAVTAAREATDRARDENERFTEEKKQRAEDLKDLLDKLAVERSEKLHDARQALNDLRQKHNQERAMRVSAFRTEIADEDRAFRTKIQIQREKYAAEDAALMQHNINQLSLTQSYYDAATQLAIGNINTIKSLGGTGTGGGGGFSNPLGDSGFVIPPPSTQSSANGPLSLNAPISINGTNMSAAEVEQVLVQKFIPKLTNALRTASRR